MTLRASRQPGMAIVMIPDIETVRRRLRQTDKALPRKLGQVHKRLASVPAQEAKRRARAKGSGYVRLAADIRPLSNQRNIQVKIGGQRRPDSVGWEFGAIRWPQFDAWTGNGDDAGYVVFALRRDDAWMGDFHSKVVAELSEFLGPLAY
jgi:hypothetical protein